VDKRFGMSGRRREGVETLDEKVADLRVAVEDLREALVEMAEGSEEDRDRARGGMARYSQDLAIGFLSLQKMLEGETIWRDHIDLNEGFGAAVNEKFLGVRPPSIAMQMKGLARRRPRQRLASAGVRLASLYVWFDAAGESARRALRESVDGPSWPRVLRVGRSAFGPDADFLEAVRAGL
jgi:hypothetical protein